MIETAIETATEIPKKLLGIFALVLLWLLLGLRRLVRPRRDPAPPLPRTKPPDTPDCRLAVHEAGHAVAAWRCTAVENVHIATIEGLSSGVAGGRVSFSCDLTPGSTWCQLVIALAGVAAEAVTYGRWRTTGSEKDLLDALTHAVRLHLKPEPRPWRVFELPPLTAGIDVRKIFSHKIDPRAVEIFIEGFFVARRFASDPAHGRLVGALLGHGTMKSARLEVVLGSRIETVSLRLAGYIYDAISKKKRPARLLPRFTDP